MKTALGWLGLVTMGAFLLTASSGCEVACKDDEEKQGTTCIAKSLKRFTANQPGNDSATWTPGGTITVDGVFGNIVVEATSADNTVNVTSTAFSYRGHDQEADAIRDMEEALKTEAVEDGSGVLVRSWREGTHGSSLGADLFIKIPSSFDGVLKVLNRGNGDVGSKGEFDLEVNSLGSAIALDVSTGSDLGKCNIHGAPSVTQSDVHCGSHVWLRQVTDSVNVSTTFGAVIDEAIYVEWASMSAGSGGTITSEDGDILLILPPGNTFSIQAQSSADGVVDVVNNPAECTVDEAAATAKTLSCGAGGPNYVVTAGTDSLGESNIKLEF